MFEEVVDDDADQLVLVHEPDRGGKPVKVVTELAVRGRDVETSRRRLHETERLPREAADEAGLAGAERTKENYAGDVHDGFASEGGLAIGLGGHRAQYHVLHCGGKGGGGREGGRGEGREGGREGGRWR